MMSLENHLAEENLRQAAAEGNIDFVNSLIESNVNVNSKNSINGWTALHWACKRGHQSIASILLRAGADPQLTTSKGETCVQVSSDPQIRIMLGDSADASDQNAIAKDQLPIVPNYISNPVFIHGNSSGQKASNQIPGAVKFQQSNFEPVQFSGELVLKVRIANSDEKDFIEIDLPRDLLTYDSLISLMCSELGANKDLIQKVRKLPDTIIRRDRDVQRLCNYQELELVLVNQVSTPVNSFQNYKASVAPKHFDVFY